MLEEQSHWRCLTHVWRSIRVGCQLASCWAKLSPIYPQPPPPSRVQMPFGRFRIQNSICKQMQQIGILPCHLYRRDTTRRDEICIPFAGPLGVPCHLFSNLGQAAEEAVQATTVPATFPFAFLSNDKSDHNL